MKKIVFAIGILSLTVNCFTAGVVYAQNASDIQAAAPIKSDYVLFVEVKVKPENVLDFKKALLSIVASTQVEVGNLAYIVHQSPDDQTDFMVYEHWQSDADHVLHLQNPTFVNYSKTVAPMMETGYPIRKKMIDLE